MSNLFASLGSSAGALQVFQRVLDASQNNVVNASTSGYARTEVPLKALPFQPETGLLGGVSSGPAISARDFGAEVSVWHEAARSGWDDAEVRSLTSVQAGFPITDGSGISAALDRFYSACSAWSVAPNDGPLRQSVVEAAGQIAAAFQQAAAAVRSAARGIDQDAGRSVDRINNLAVRLADLNTRRRQIGRDDPGLAAQVYAALEDLSAETDVQVLEQEDGTVTVMLAGGPLLVGSRSYPLSAVPGQTLSIRTEDGTDVTAQIKSGNLGGLLDVRNNVIAGLVGDGTRTGELNRLAMAFADRVNAIVGQGVDAGGNAAPGPLFVYNPAAPAASLAVSTGFDGTELPAIIPGPPAVSNGVALQLAAMSGGENAADQVGGLSFTEFYGDVAAGVGRRLASSTDDQDTSAQLLAQARNLRSQVSGVSLDNEAAVLMQFQRGYEAAAKMVTVVDELMQTVLGMIR